MAEKVWDTPIDEHVDWGGDDSTGGLPVSGRQIQDFIKKTLKTKASIFDYNTATNRYNVFSDEETRDKYYEDPTQTQLVLASFDAPFNYTAEIALITPVYNAIFAGSTGNYIDFTFDIKNKQGQSTYESVICTYTIRRGSTSQTVMEQYAAGRLVHFNIDKYLAEGANNITIGIQGTNTLAATVVSVTFQVVNLELTTSYDISQVYDLSTSSQTMAIPFSVGGYGTKIVEWYLDGEKLEFVKDVDEVVDVSVSRTKYINLSNLSQGTHNIQIRTYTLIEGDTFYSDTLYREFMVYTGVSDETLLAIAMTIPSRLGIIDSRKLYGITQYVPYTLTFATYSPKHTSLNVDIELNDSVQGSVLSYNETVNEFTLAPSVDGPSTIALITEDTVFNITTDIATTTMNIAEITDALQLDFRALGRNNNAIDKDVWTYNTYQGTFTGFDWNPSSGWVNNELYINSGASFGINLAPLAQSPTKSGKTIEVEFSTVNVNDDNAIICDLRDDNGAGMLITATKVSLVSEGGVTIETPFKDNETIRVAFVINKSADATNKCMSFIYINGKVARGTSWASVDDYVSSKEILFVGSKDAEIKLSSLRIYNSALTSDQILNNYILYRKNVVDMYDIYERNDVYTDGTSSFDPEKMVSRLPVMIITGEIPVLEATTDKNKQIVVDIEYTNLQDPTRNFVWKSAALRPQGTSSMAYPKKNFRPYSNKLDSTVCYDSQGKVVKDRLYAFKDKSQRVDCWCLKADYAESSGAHNTGIARLWNDILLNSTIDGEYVFRTEAQKIAIANELGYDVRTTVDGFPILVFYRLTPDDPLVFIGKYNFNNDKSTPSVFGFENIEGFDNSKMQCWEVLNNGNALALFNTIEGFDSDWGEAFESRYPDTKTPETKYLKAFCTWMSSVTKEKFVTEKWDHLDVYKVAAYYVYLLRFGAVDQTTKNAMLTSEDGQKFYYINYDNDTINGLTNEGKLVVPWNADRTTIGEDGQPYYAGPNNRLWNMLEDDEEFMSIVRQVDEALYIGGLRYDNVIKMFDDNQTGKWVERVYNQDSQYKYIGPFVERGVDNLFMLQGDRSTHRKYWLARRFGLFDSKFISGDYKSQAIEIKCINNTPVGQEIGITAGTNMDYGYGINNIAREGNITLDENESYTFVTREVVNLGDPIRIYGAPNIKGLDLSKMSDRLAVITLDKAYNTNLGTKLTHLTIGGDATNTSVESISGLSQCSKLEHLDVRNMRGLKSLDLSNHYSLKHLDARGTNISFVQFAKGGSLESFFAPETMKSLDLEDLPRMSSENLIFENISTIHTINVKNCPNISNDFSWVKTWLTSKETVDSKCSFTMNNVSWEDISPADLETLGKIGHLKLTGTVKLTEITESYINIFTELFGNSVFDKNSEFFVDAPPSIFISGRTSMLEGDSETYTTVVFGAEVTSIGWSIISGSSSYVTLDAQTATLTVREGYGSGTIQLRARVFSDKGITDKLINISIVERVYPDSNTTISGNRTIDSDLQKYILVTSSGVSITGAVTSEWTLTGFDDYLEISSSDEFSCTIKKIKELSAATITGTLTVVVTRTSNNNKWTFTKEVVMVNEAIAESDPGICKALYDAGLCANETYITKVEAQAIVAEDLYTGTFPNSSNSIFYSQRSNIKNFEGFKYFTGVTKLPNDMFEGWSKIESIDIPESVVSIGSSIFYGNNALKKIKFPRSVKTLRAHLNLPSVCAIYISDLQAWIEISGNYGFANDSGIGNRKIFLNGELVTQLVIPGNIKSIRENCFNGWNSVTSVVISEGVEYFGSNAFNGCKLTDISFPSTLISGGVIGDNGISSNIRLSGHFVENDGKTLIIRGQLAYIHPSIKMLSEWEIPKHVTELSRSVLSGWYNLENIIFPDSLVTIGDHAFNGCSKLTSCIIPNTVTTIGNSAFYYCRGLKTIVIPSSVTTIGEDAFYLGTSGSVESVTIESGNMLPTCRVFGYCAGELILDRDLPYISRGSDKLFYGSIFSKIVIGPNVTEKTSAEYQGGILAADGDVHLPNLSILCSSKIAELWNTTWNLYINNTLISELIIPDNIDSIVKYAFRGCTSLEKVIIPNTVTSIGYQAFTGCGGELIINCNINSVNSNKNGAFYNANFTKITFGNNVTSIGDQEFNNCSLLEELILPEHVTKFGYNLFANCQALKSSIAIPEGVTELGNYCFDNCTNIPSISLPSTLTKIGVSVLRNSTNMSTIWCYSNKVTCTDSSTFANCGDSVDSNVVKMLYVPTNGEGYDSGRWQTLQTSYGFNLSKTL